MSITATDRHYQGNVKENWLIRLYYDGGTSYFGVAPQTRNLSGVIYHGFVTNTPSIRHSIDLQRCTSDVSNVTLTLANVNYLGSPLSDELMPGGSRKYVNREVRIYSELNDTSSLQQIYTGRLKSVSYDKDEVRLVIEPNQPWDYIEIPNVQAASGRYFPVVYGDFAYNGVDGYAQYKSLWPAQVDAQSNEGIWVLYPFATSDSTYRLHVYEEAQDRFIPLEDGSGTTYYTTTTGYDSNGDAIKAPAALIHSWKYKPLRISDDDPGDFTNPANAIDTPNADDDSTTAATLNTTDQGTWDLIFECQDSQFPPYDATAADYQIVFYVRMQVTDTTTDPDVYIRFDSTEVATLDIPNTDLSTYSWTITSATWDLKKLPGQIRIRVDRNTPNSTACNFSIYDVRLLVTCQVDPTDLADAKRSKQEIDFLYCGGDGLARSWSSGSCDDIQEIHRDLLIRYTGLTTSTPDGYSDLDTARAGWQARLWLHEPTKLKEILEQVQYEGQFVFDWAADGDPRYIFVKSSYSAGDVALTLDPVHDLHGLKRGHIPFTDIITKQEIKYERHPADDSRYLSSHTKTNSTARTAWDIQTDENIANVELDYLCAEVDTANTGFADIVDLVHGDLRKTWSAEGCQALAWTLEVGDIVQLTGDSEYYMVTKLTRKPGSVRIDAREVG